MKRKPNHQPLSKKQYPHKKQQKQHSKQKQQYTSKQENDSAKRIEEEIEQIEKVGRVIPDEEKENEEDIFEDIHIEQETDISEIPNDISDDCQSFTFLSRPFEEAMNKKEMKQLEKTEEVVIQSNFDFKTPKTTKTGRTKSIPIPLWKEFEEFLSANELELNDIEKRELYMMREYSDCYIIRHMTDEQLAIHRLITTLHIACHLREIRLLRLKHTFEHQANPENELQRDMGLVKPTVLCLFPFKSPAITFIKTVLSLYGEEFQQNIQNEERFAKEFEDVQPEIKTLKPREFYQIFEGNNEDHFRVGVKFGKNGVQFYANFYECDMIIASPLGIKMFIANSTNGEGQDILSSIKLLYIQSIDTMEMQNISHVIDIMKCINKMPKKQHSTDIRRVYEHEIEEKNQFYRQTIIYSRYVTPLTNSVIRMCSNNHQYQITERTIKGTLSNIIRTIPITFYKYHATTPMNSPDERYDYFTKKFITSYSDGIKSKTLFYIPSYFDYLRIKQYLIEENVRCICLCEFSSDRAISSARSRFYHDDDWEFLVITERFHFFNRFKIKGIKHLLFYEIPTATHYVPEFINMINGNVNDASVHILFNHMDKLKIRSVCGDERAAYLMTMSQDKHTYV